MARKPKRVEAWAVDTDGYYWVFPFRQDADDKLHDRKADGEPDAARVVHLVECGPGEVVMPKAAAAVVEDLKARLRVCRTIIAAQVKRGVLVNAAQRITDLRVKDWKAKGGKR